MKRVRIKNAIVAIWVLCCAGLTNAQAIIPQVVLLEGDSLQFRSRVIANLEGVLKGINLYADRVATTLNIAPYCTDEGYKTTRRYVEKYRLYAQNAVYHALFVRTMHPDTFLVRDIEFWSLAPNTQRKNIMLIFKVNRAGKVVGLKEGISLHRYKNLREVVPLVDSLQLVWELKEFVDDFAEAYKIGLNGAEGLEFLEKVFSDGALIIVGFEPGFQGISVPDSVILTEKPKRQYLDKLKQIINHEKQVEVEVDSIEITRHPEFKDIFGISLYQQWNPGAADDRYTDEGYLFIVVEFRGKPKPPVIHVRVWQNNKIKPDERMKLDDYEFYRKKKGSS